MKIRAALSEGILYLKDKNIEYYKEDAMDLLVSILNVDKLFIIMDGDKEIDAKDLEIYKSHLKRRGEKEPLKYIIGTTSFYGEVFKVKKGVLIPRVDTETLIEEALLHIKDGDEILDMCCGSGAIGITLAKNTKNTKIDLVDISKIAEEVTLENISTFKLENCEFIHSDLFENVNKKYDVIVSNPPYISSSDVLELDEDVKDYEPRLALDGGDDGLDFYKKIIMESKKYLKDEGYLCFEIGYDQGQSVPKLMEEEGFNEIKAIKDLSGNYRVVSGRL